MTTGGPAPVQLERAELLLSYALEAGGGAVPSAMLDELAADAGISRRTMSRARRRVGATAERRGDAWFVVIRRQGE